MTSKGLLAVSFFFALMVASSLSSASTATAIDFTHTPIAAGMPVTITVLSAPCHPIRVILTINGQEIAGQIGEVPGVVTLQVPEGAQGQCYALELRCPTDRGGATGIVL